MATKSIAWNTGSGNITLTYTGQGDGPISVQSDVNDGNARSQVITIQTTKGGLITKNVTVSQAACPVPVGTVLNYAYTGSYQEVELPAGQYKLQCWGAQGGSNGTNSNYGITAKAGGKGGYSEGIITLSQKTTFRIYVGGQGSASAGGFNGGGSTTGTSQYNANNEFGYSKMGGGGGATDIRLSYAALLSRMIVAGGGSGGAMCYRSVTTTTWEDLGTLTYSGQSAVTGTINGMSPASWIYESTYHTGQVMFDGIPFNAGDVIRITPSNTTSQYTIGVKNYYKWSVGYVEKKYFTSTITWTVPNAGVYLAIDYNNSSEFISGTLKIERQVVSTSTSTKSQVGYAGGGVSADGWHNGTYYQPGRNGSFGAGANVTVTNYRYVGAAGGGGWNGGGNNYSNSDTDYVNRSGGGCGWVNIADNASFRPSGYVGLQLDSGETKAGNTSFPSTSGGNETGHSGNGYARITRLS